MQKQKPAYNHLLGLMKLIPGIQRTINHQPKRTRMMSIGKTGMRTRTKTRLSLTTSLLLIVSLKPRPPRKTNVKENVKEVI